MERDLGRNVKVERKDGVPHGRVGEIGRSKVPSGIFEWVLERLQGSIRDGLSELGSSEECGGFERDETCEEFYCLQGLFGDGIGGCIIR